MLQKDAGLRVALKAGEKAVALREKSATNASKHLHAL
jgi:hypothetical protein